MPATLLHITYDKDRRQNEVANEDIFKVMMGSVRSIEETRAVVGRMLAAGDYWAVAEFDSVDLEHIWHAAQNGTLSPSWSRQPPKGVRPLGDGTVFGGYGYRSSMVGDIVVVDGNFHIVANMGFENLGSLPVQIDGLPRPKDESSGRRLDPVADPGSVGISAIVIHDDRMDVRLTDDRSIEVPFDRYPRLAVASAVQRSNFRLSRLGVHWPDIDEDLSTQALVLDAEAATPKPR